MPDEAAPRTDETCTAPLAGANLPGTSCLSQPRACRRENRFENLAQQAARSARGAVCEDRCRSRRPGTRGGEWQVRSFADYAAGVDEGWSKDTMARMVIHDLPRQFIALDRDAQRRVLEEAPPLTGTAWDALLAAMAEHLAELHDHPVQPWMDEPERFPRRDLGARCEHQHPAERPCVRTPGVRAPRRRHRPARSRREGRRAP